MDNMKLLSEHIMNTLHRLQLPLYAISNTEVGIGVMALGCRSTCSGSCSGSCAGDCEMSCAGSCELSCAGDCDFSCTSYVADNSF